MGVGLIPGGGGTKEMLARAVLGLPANHPDLMPFVQQAFETIGFAKVSTSAADAGRLGFFGDADRVTMNRERLMADAKAFALERVQEGYQRPAPRTATPVGGETVLADQARRPPGVARRADQRSRAGRGRALANVLSAARCRADDGPRAISSTWNAGRFSSCAASARRSSASSTR